MEFQRPKGDLTNYRTPTGAAMLMVQQPPQPNLIDDDELENIEGSKLPRPLRGDDIAGPTPAIKAQRTADVNVYTTERARGDAYVRLLTKPDAEGGRRRVIVHHLFSRGSCPHVVYWNVYIGDTSYAVKNSDDVVEPLRRFRAQFRGTRFSFVLLFSTELTLTSYVADLMLDATKTNRELLNNSFYVLFSLRHQSRSRRSRTSRSSWSRTRI